MQRMKVAATALMTLTLCTRSLGIENTPRQIFNKAIETYAAMNTYKAEGTVTGEIDSGNGKTKLSTSFSLLLKKPNMYLITWNQKTTLAPEMVQSGAVWSDGTQPYLYLGVMNAYSRIGTDELALSGATGVSGGAAFTIPSLFLPVFHGQAGRFSRLSDLTLEPSEVIGDDDCYVISGSSAMSKRETYWISKANFLVRKYYRSFEPPEGGREMPVASDEQIGQSLKAMGVEATEEAAKEARELMTAASKMMKTMNFKGSSTEIHSAVSSPELSEDDFAFVLPAGVALSESLFGESRERRRELVDRIENRDVHSLAMQGGDLTAEEAEALEQHLDRNPEDAEARTKLLGYYFAKPAGATKAKHILWLIRHVPEHEILGLPYGEWDAKEDQETYAQGKAIWIDHLKREPDNLKLLEHSARYFRRCDRDLARNSLERAQSLDRANPKWPSELGHLSAHGMIAQSGEVNADAAATALGHFEIAYNLSTGAGKNLLLQYLAQAAFAANNPKKAKEYADLLLSQEKSGWNHGNNLHHGNILLGRIALASGDLEDAKARLIEAGKTPGSPQLDSFGPSLSLARELLQRGEKETVLRYLELCSTFWKMGKRQLEEWSVAIKEGRIPDFGPHLRY